MIQGSSKNARRPWKFTAWLLVGLINIVSIGGYVILSITLNAQAPDRQKNDGIAFIMQPASESEADRVDFYADSDAASSHPLTYYDIVACGPSPYNGTLVLLGDARLANMQHSGLKLQNISENSHAQYQPIKNVIPFYAGSSQLVSFELPAISCPELDAEQGLQGPAEVSGNLSAPLQESWSGPWGLWHGPHAAQSWPEIGSDLSLQQTKFAVVGTSGVWRYPSNESVHISSDNVYSPAWSVDAADPEPSGSIIGGLNWASSVGGISPTAQITNTQSVAPIQDWIVACVLGFGIGGAMLSSVIFELIRPGKRQNDSSHQPMQEYHPRAPQQVPRFSRWLVLIGVALILGYVRGRRRVREP